MEIHLAYHNIDTYLLMSPTHPVGKRYYRTQSGQAVHSIQTVIYDSKTALSFFEPSLAFGNRLKNSDDEIEMELLGKILNRTHHLVVDSRYQPVYDFKVIDQLTKPDGSMSTRSHKQYAGNINSTIPVRVTDRYYSIQDIIFQFVFRKSYYLYHTDGVSYKFLYDIARYLVDKQKLVRVIAYEKEKTPGPLVLYHGGFPFSAAFLEGLIQDEKYCLILHLADRELRLPEKLINSGTIEPEIGTEVGS